MTIPNFAEHLLASRCARQHGFDVKWYNAWNGLLDDVLRQLPEEGLLSRELFSLIMKNPGITEKRTILVLKSGMPVSLAGIRRLKDHWEPVTNWAIPGALFPMKADLIDQILPSLGICLNVGWWRRASIPPPMRFMNNLKQEPTYGFDLSENYEQYWRSNDKFFTNLRNIRNKCKGLEFGINQPGALDWIIRGWEAKWRPPQYSEMPDFQDRMAIARYLQDRQYHYSVSLSSTTGIAAGMTLVKHGNELVAQVNFRDPAYDRQGAMTRLLDLTFGWAKEQGFSKLDLGGSHEYKQKWAPELGQKWTFQIIPDYIARWEKVSDRVSHFAHRFVKG